MLNPNTLSFDNFARSDRDIVCVQPIRTIIRLEEEITIVKKIRKVEEIEIGMGCPAPSQQMVQTDGQFSPSYSTGVVP